MKKLIISFVAIAAFIIGSLSVYNATAYVSGDCPNGCMLGGNGCYCNGWWPNTKEAIWAQI